MPEEILSQSDIDALIARMQAGDAAPVEDDSSDGGDDQRAPGVD